MLQTVFSKRSDNASFYYQFRRRHTHIHSNSFPPSPITLALMAFYQGFPTQSVMRIPTAPFIRWDERCSIYYSKTKRNCIQTLPWANIFKQQPNFRGNLASWFCQISGTKDVVIDTHTHTHINKNNGVVRVPVMRKTDVAITCENKMNDMKNGVRFHPPSLIASGLHK